MVMRITAGGTISLWAVLCLLLASAVDLSAQPAMPFNSAAHELTSEVSERSRLLSNTPQWVVQQLTWPPNGEIESHLGIRDVDQVAQATENAHLILRPDHISPTLSDQWVPLRDWNIFYTDWIDHGGADTFLTNYTLDEIRFQLADTPNFVIVGVRPVRGRPLNMRLEAWVLQVVEALLTEEVQPESTDDTRSYRILEIYEPDEIIEGDWLPRGPEGRRRGVTTSASTDIERVKFFTDGLIVVLSVPKFLWDPTSLVNPFAERFPEPSSPAEIVAMTQMLFHPESSVPEPVATDQTMVTLLEQLLIETPGDVLIMDWSRRMGDVNLDHQRMGRMFSDMSPEQQGLWHAQQLSERLMAEGARALGDRRYDEAATRFGHALILDPLNVSAAWMLEVTRQRARSWAVEVEQPLPLPWFAAADQLLMRHRNAVEERRIQTEERSQRDLALRDLRTQWHEAYAERDLRRARQILHRMLDLEPGDASTLFFVDLIEHLLAVEDRETH
jgi:hypothetical protein